MTYRPRHATWLYRIPDMTFACGLTITNCWIDTTPPAGGWNRLS